MSRADSERPILIIQDENQPPRHWPLSKDDVILGRDEECDLPLPIRQISRQHIRIYRQGELYFVEDLDSKNGTWVNGLQLKGSRELLSTEAPAFITGRLRLDPEARRVFIRGVELNPPLSLPQYRLLELLYVNTGRICTRDHVIETVWPEALGEGVSEQAIDALVRRLRDRLAELDPETQYVVTVRGHGFRLDNPPG